MRTVLLTIKYALLIVLLSILLALLYLTVHGLPDALTRVLEKRIQFGGTAVRLDTIKLSIFEGLIVTRVRCYRKKDIGSPLFEIEKVVLELQPARWFKGESGVKGARIRNGIVRLAVGDGDEMRDPGAAGRARVLEIDEVNALLIFDQARLLRVADFSTEILNIKIVGRGEVILPEEIRPEPAALAGPGGEGMVCKAVNQQLAGELVRWIERLLSGNVVNADVDFVIDPSNISNLDIRVKMESRVAETSAKNSWAGTWSASVDVKGKKGQGVVDIRDYSVYGVWVERALGSFQFDDKGLSLQQFDAVVGKRPWQGPLSFSMFYDWNTRRYEGTVSTGFDPHALFVPLRDLKRPAADVIEDLQFDFGPPVCSAHFNGTAGDDPAFSIQGTAHAVDCRYEGVSNALVSTGFSVEFSETNELMRLAPLRVVREEGCVQGELELNFMSQTVGFEGVSTADPKAVARMIGPFMEKVVGKFRFEGPVKVTASGSACYMDGARNDINVFAEGRKFGWDKFLCDNGSLHVRVTGNTVQLTDVRGTAYGGKFDGRVSVHPVPGATNMRYKVDGKVDDVDFGILMHTIAGGNADAYRGKCSAEVSLEGCVGADAGKTAEGHGEIEITGPIFQIPLFGGLSDLLTTLVPGLSILLRQTDAKASVVIGDGRIHSDRILVEGDVLSLRGTGDYSLDGELDFDVQVSLFRKHTLVGEVMRIVTLPVSTMLEFHLDGTIGSPRWRPVYLPKEMFLMFD